MPRLTFPDEGSRLAYRMTTANQPLLSAAGASVVVYSNSLGTVLADIQTVGGGAIGGSVFAIGADSLLPLFLGPNDGADTLYVRVDGGAAFAVYARADDRIDANSTLIATKADAAATTASLATKISTSDANAAYQPLPTGTPTVGQVPTVSTASPLALVWGAAGGVARAARAFRSAALSVANATLTAIPLDAESFDSDALHDNATNNSRIVLNKVGVWLVQGQISYGGSTTGQRQARISVNGVQNAYQNLPSGAGQNPVQVSTVVRATVVTDYAELSAFQDSGAANNLGTGTAETWFAATYLGT